MPLAEAVLVVQPDPLAWFDWLVPVLNDLGVDNWAAEAPGGAACAACWDHWALLAEPALAAQPNMLVRVSPVAG